MKHLDRSSRPTRDHSSSGPFGFSSYYQDDDDYDYSDDEHYDDDYSDDEMDFYRCVILCQTPTLAADSISGSCLKNL